MTRTLGVRSWCLIGVGALASCRVGYDEISTIAQGAGGSVGGGGGGVGGSGVGGTDPGAGEAGAEATGGTSLTGGSAGASTTGGVGGASASGGKGGAGGSAGSASGGKGGTSGGSGGASGGSGGSSGGAGGTAGNATSGAGGGGGASGGGGTAGGLGQGGYAGASSLGDCQSATYGAYDYLFCNVDVPWATARDNCWSIGMVLARVEDAAENQWLHDNAYDSSPRKGLWIGANDLDVEGEWRWLNGDMFWLGDSTGSAQNGLYSAWHSVQPRAQEPTSDCAVIDLGNTVGWYDTDCAISQVYVCKW